MPVSTLALGLTLLASPPPSSSDEAPVGPVPPSGVGMMTSGSLATALGLWSAGLGTVAYATGATSRENPAVPATLAGGLVSLGVGVPLLTVGIVRHVRYRRWQHANYVGQRDTGLFLIHGGAWVMSAGVAGIVLSSYLLHVERDSPYNVWNGMGLGLSTAVAGSGVTMVIVGTKVRGRYLEWTGGERFTLHPFAGPAGSPRDRGFMLGVHGRF